MAGIFYILSSGLVMSVFVAAIEILYKTIVDSRKSKVFVPYNYSNKQTKCIFDIILENRVIGDNDSASNVVC